MSASVGTPPHPPLPYRARPPQVLLAVGAVLLVSAGAAVGSAFAGSPVRLLLLVLAGTAAGFSLRAARMRLRSSEEILAACAAGLALVADDPAGPTPGNDAETAAALAVLFLVLYRLAPTTAAWPLASWAALQLAVLQGLDAVPPSLHTLGQLSVALVGLGITLFGRRIVARAALVTSAPWWAAGVLGGSVSAWVDTGGRQWLSAALMVAAAMGLLLARLREVVDPLLGPPGAVPVVSGLVAGAAAAGVLSSQGVVPTTLTGYLGVLLATAAAAFLPGWRRGMLLPTALAGGGLMALLCVGRLVAGERWAALCLLLVLTALPTVLVAVRRPEDRPVAVPAALACLGGAALLSLSDRLLTPLAAAVVLTALYAAALAVGSGLDAHSRRATAGAAALCAAAAFLLVAARGDRLAVAVLLAAQGACTLGWAWRTGRPRADDDSAELSTGAWRVGAGQLVVAAWVAAAALDLSDVEWYSLPAAAGLLLGAGWGLRYASSWSAWGPGLLVAAVPSTVLAVVAADGPRAVGVVLAAAVAMVAGARTDVRAPLMIGAGTAVVLGLGLTVRELPWPIGTALLLVGSALLAVGMRRERRPVAGFGARLADLR
ncbi:MAG TPA: hypothetical protein VGD12_14960 [Blastococcus sp.]|jgi:hypothetical protein